MERPKVRFSKDYNGFKENEPEFFDLTKNDPKIKTVVPVKYNISYLKNDRKFIFKSTVEDDSRKLEPENVQQNGFLESSEEQIHNEHNNSSIKTDSQIDDSFLKHELRAEEEYRIEQEMKKSTENMRNLKLNSESPTIKTLTEHEPVLLETEESTKNIVNLDQQNLHESTKSIVNFEQQVLHEPPKKIIDHEHQNLHKSSTSTIPCIDCYDTDEENDIEVVNVINNSVVQENKKKSVPEDKIPSKTSLKLNHKTNPSKSTNNIEDIAKHLSSETARKAEDLKKSSTRKTVSFGSGVKSGNKIQVAPCYKYKFLSENKESNLAQRKPTAVKKTILLNPEKKSENVAVIPSSSFDNHKLDVEEESTQEIASENLLSRPEFNSSVHLMKKLKDLEREKKLTNINQLSPNYKSLIHGKVSAALNFPPHEPVFKDLVNLSVDDDVLASRFVRTKDPEPRPKEIVPDLNHFYTPRQIEPKFHTYSQIHPRITNVGNWSAMKIFNKLTAWKAKLDGI